MKDYTKEEIVLLKENGYSALAWFAWNNDYPKIDKNSDNNFQVGIEGTAMDVDGDWGWCRTWYTYNSLKEAVDFALKR